MPQEWKSKHQTPATPEQLALYEASKPQHAANHDANAPGTQLPLRLHSDVCCTEPSPTSAGAIGAPYCGALPLLVDAALAVTAVTQAPRCRFDSVCSQSVTEQPIKCTRCECMS